MVVLLAIYGCFTCFYCVFLCIEMDLNFSINEFSLLYSNKLLNKEEILNRLKITEYIYKKIIKEFNLSRPKTSKINRFKAHNNIEVIKVPHTTPSLEIVKTNDEALNEDKSDDKINLKEELRNEIRRKLDASRKNRNKNNSN